MITRFLQIIVVAILALLRVSGDSTCYPPGFPDNPTLTVHDSEPFQNCTTFNGSIEVVSNFVGVLDFGSLHYITGGILISDVSGLTSVVGASLTTIGGNIVIANCSSLTRISLTNLTNTTPSSQDNPFYETLQLQIENAPLLRVVDLPWLGSANSIDINAVVSLNLSSLAGLRTLYLSGITNISAPELHTVGDLDISSSSITEISFPNLNGVFILNFNNNLFLRSISLPGVGPHLVTLMIGNNSQLESISMEHLGTVRGGLNISQNPQLAEVEMISLQEIAPFLVIDDNLSLTKLVMPEVVTVGVPDEPPMGGQALMMRNNPQLRTLDGLPQLQSVFGNVSISGNFSSSGSPIPANCSTYQKLKNENFIEGNFTCSSSNPPTSHSPAKPTGVSDSHTYLGTGAKAGIGAGAAAFGIAAIIGGALVIKRKRRRGTPKDEAGSTPVAELPGGKAAHEMESKHGQGELPEESSEAHEMPAPPSPGHE
ncbi:hypothetical protein AOQ84DRAFT_379893 [Glonium stellatum]|uniref:Uncharacterized protein n=1 Tax=Glonium stellatum TaxID=574774 RepID=A0A8E2EVL7_9PEZI|nr:hypothetical protein AOQ84DRAFT_379893 [Glonium stellatum]